MTPRPAARASRRAFLLASSVTFSTVLTGAAASAGAFGWAVQAIALGSLAGAGWAVAMLLAALGRPGWTPAEKTLLRGGMDAGELFEKLPESRGELR